MHGWIISRFLPEQSRPQTYSIHRFLNAARDSGVSLDIIAPERISVVAGGTKSKKACFMVDGIECPAADFVMCRMGSATNYYALALLRQFEEQGIFVVNSSRAIALTKDKFHTMQVLTGAGIPVAKSILAKYPLDIDFIESQFGFPVVVKTLSGSQGRGVFLCQTRAQFEGLIAMITVSRGNPNFIIQEFIRDSLGRDLRVIVAYGKVVGCMLRQAMPGMFMANYSRGAKVQAFDINPQILNLSLETARVTGLDIAGIDLLFDRGEYKICEANSSPGFKGMDECLNTDIALKLLESIKLAKSRALDPLVISALNT